MGKDTVGAMLMRQHNLPRRAFAQAVKQVVTDCFGFSADDIEKWKTEATNAPGLLVSMRETLQRVGDGFREIRPSVWIDMALSSPDTSGVFCDVRYLNEARALKQRNATLVLVGRSSALNDDANPSEASLRPLIAWFLAHTRDHLVFIANVPDAPPEAKAFDWFVRNDESLHDLEAAVGRIR